MSIRTNPPTLARPKDVTDSIQQFIQQVVSDAGANGVVVNLSGGIDSTVAATLATESLGSDRVTGLILPAAVNRTENTDDALKVAEELVIDYRIIEIQDLLDAFTRTVSSVTHAIQPDPMQTSSATVTVPDGNRENFTESMGNAAARLRMMIAYFEANTTNQLVLGTGNRTELLLGYFTKYGDGGVDLLPIGDLFKTEVRQIARTLNIHKSIIDKDPTAGLWAGQTDEDELGAPYPLIDTMLWHLQETEATVETVASRLDESPSRIDRFDRMIESAAHKRETPATPVHHGYHIYRG